MRKVTPVFAGTWYPGSKGSLEKLMQNFFIDTDIARIGKNDNLIGIIAPHAGMRYSGNTAAFAYANLQRAVSNDDLVILLAPSHRGQFSGGAAYLEDAEIITPLGALLSCTTLADVMDKEIFVHEPDIVKNEHAIELHLPFIYHVTRGNCRVMPVVIGNNSEGNLRTLADGIFSACQSWQKLDSNRGRSVFIIASSDLSHFHSANKAEKLDGRIIHYIKESLENEKPLFFQDQITNGRIEACGGGPISILLDISIQLKMATKERLGLKGIEYNRTHSGMVTGDNSNVVGYLSAGVYRTLL